MKKKQIINLGIIFILFLLDRLSKIFIINFNESNEQINITVTSFLNLKLIWNEGIAFGLLSFEDQFSYNLITLIIIFVILILFIMLNRAERLNRFAIIMVLGGALGNLFDRIFYSAVPDFVEIYYKSFHWFIFNVADIFITFGVFCLIYVELISKDKSNEKNL
tara:strand:+ start:874 stop:1362 length:489 start_codon:yes stop_codon:yes gene_type:complete